MDDLDINTWKNVESKAINSGYRDGISDGRESNFQKSFDQGYKQGFNIGSKLGYYKGYLTAQNKDTPDEVLQKVTIGNCQMCKNPNIEQETISNLNSLQNETMKNVFSTLQTKYPNLKTLNNFK